MLLSSNYETGVRRILSWGDRAYDLECSVFQFLVIRRFLEGRKVFHGQRVQKNGAGTRLVGIKEACYFVNSAIFEELVALVDGGFSKIKLDRIMMRMDGKIILFIIIFGAN